jgi:hypothetical protein
MRLVHRCEEGPGGDPEALAPPRNKKTGLVLQVGHLLPLRVSQLYFRSSLSTLRASHRMNLQTIHSSMCVTSSTKSS